MIKVLVLIIIVIMLVILTALPSDAQSAKSKKAQKELTVYARVKDHITHLDIDSTVTARLLSASDSSMIDTIKINKAYYEDMRRTINAQGKTETFYNIIPSYCLLHLTWRLK